MFIDSNIVRPGSYINRGSVIIFWPAQCIGTLLLMASQPYNIFDHQTSTVNCVSRQLIIAAALNVTVILLLATMPQGLGLVTMIWT